MTYVMETCQVCGIEVKLVYQQLHEQWHAATNEYFNLLNDKIGAAQRKAEHAENWFRPIGGN